jgi:selenocysteine lyase/cysteine desulfurase
VGTAREKAGVLSFVMDGIHPHDIGTILDQEGIAVRTGVYDPEIPVNVVDLGLIYSCAVTRMNREEGSSPFAWR